MALTVDLALSACCAELRHQLVALNAPNTYNTLANYGIISALESDQNMAGVDPALKRQLEAQWGKGAMVDGDAACTFKLWVTRPNCGTATEGAGTVCGNSNTTGPVERRTQIDIKIEKAWSTHGKIEPGDFNCLCAGTQAQVLTREIAEGAKAILNSVAAEIATDALAAMGNYTNGIDSKATPIDLNLLSASATGLFAQPVGWTTALLEYRKMQTQGGIIAVGGDLVYAYNSALNLAPSLSPGGYSLPNGVSSYFDTNVQALADATLTAPLLTWAPGALWIMRYLDNVRVAENHIASADVERTVVNLWGQLFDLTIIRDCEILRWVLQYRYELYALPGDVYGDCLETVQRQVYNVGCDVMDCADLALPEVV